jgi:hypothetical protein
MIKATVALSFLTTALACAEPTEWKLSGDRVVRLDTSEERARLFDATGSLLYTFGRSESVKGSSLSQNGGALLLQVMERKAAAPDVKIREADYSYLLRVFADGLGRLHLTQVMENWSPELAAENCFVSKIHSVSDDGRRAQLSIGRGLKEPPKTTYARETWDIVTPNRLSVESDTEQAKPQ